jgi:hypothetical protein
MGKSLAIFQMKCWSAARTHEVALLMLVFGAWGGPMMDVTAWRLGPHRSVLLQWSLSRFFRWRTPAIDVCRLCRVCALCANYKRTGFEPAKTEGLRDLGRPCRPATNLVLAPSDVLCDAQTSRLYGCAMRCFYSYRLCPVCPPRQQLLQGLLVDIATRQYHANMQWLFRAGAHRSQSVLQTLIR